MKLEYYLKQKGLQNEIGRTDCSGRVPVCVCVRELFSSIVLKERKAKDLFFIYPMQAEAIKCEREKLLTNSILLIQNRTKRILK